jgi:uncharacterized protein (DUF58 family)
MGHSVVLERLPASAGINTSTTGKTHLRKRVYIFLTRYGFIFSINLLVMLLGSVNYNNSLAYALTFLLAGLFMVSMLHTYNNLRGLIINNSSPDPVFAGQQACFPLLLDNRHGSPRLAINFQLQSAVKKSNPVLVQSTDLDRNNIQTLNFNIDTVKRGHFVPGRIKISSTWPIGLFRAWSYLQINEPCIVYPRPSGTTILPEQTSLEGEEQVGTGIGSEDFTGFRQYQSGDSLRAVDWKAYSRERGLLTKRFSGRGTKKILIDWQHTNHIADLEQRLSQLCLWVIEAEKQGALYALTLPGETGQHFDKGEVHKHKCLQALAEYG